MPLTYNLSSYRITGRVVLFVNNTFDYPVIRISGVGDIGSATNINEQAYSWHTWYDAPSTTQARLHNESFNNNWLDRSCCFNNINIPSACEVLVEFTMNLLRDPQGAMGGNNSVIRGRATHITKAVNGAATFKMYTLFERHTAATTFSQFSIGSFGGFDNSVTHASLNVEIIPLPTFT